MDYAATRMGSNIEPQSAETPPMTRDLNVLGEAIARLETNIDVLRKQLDPVIRPMPADPPLSQASDKAPKLVKADRSNNGRALENFADHVELLINRVQFLQRAVEV